ncbi:MAG: zinc ribbon domain-containing protein [Desulfobacca sp.]|nr:zinc ribbon domain-containing protein [Desulfobacca sp.]
MRPPASFCENCGAPLQADMRFCEACGHPVETAPATTSVPSPPFPPPVQPQAAVAATPKATRGRRNLFLLGGSLVLMLVLGGLGYYYWSETSDSVSTRKSVSVPIPSLPSEPSTKPPATSQPAPPSVPQPQATPVPGDLQYFLYINPKFRYRIRFPRNLLVPQGVSPSGSGQRFLAPENRAVLTVWGEYLQIGDSLKNLYKQILREPDRIYTYKVCKPDWFVVSGYLSDGRIFYRKTLFQDNMFKSFEITYEKDQKALYDNIVNHLARSFENTRPVD